MTMVVSFCLTPGPGFIAADTRRWELDGQGQVTRTHDNCSKVHRVPGRGFAGLTGIWELSREVVRAYEGHENLRAAADAWFADRDAALREGPMMEQLMQSHVHRLVPDDAGGLVLQGLDWQANMLHPQPMKGTPPRGAIFTGPLGSTPASFQPWIQRWIRDVNGTIAAATGPARTSVPVGRNAPCPCGSGRKFKKCHGTNTTAVTVTAPALLPMLIRVTAQLFARAAERYGGADGPMSEEIEFGIVQAEGEGFAEQSLGAGPLPAAALGSMRDEEINALIASW